MATNGIMEESEPNQSESGRLIKCLDEVGKRVEILRDSAIEIQREKESLLSLLQDLQDNSGIDGFPQGLPVDLSASNSTECFQFSRRLRSGDVDGSTIRLPWNMHKGMCIPLWASLVEEGSGKWPSDEREEMEFNAERLICRCLTVEVSVSTPRNEIQEKAYQKVKHMLDKLDKELKQPDVKKAVQLVNSYLNACLPEAVGMVDMRFQGNILECTIDDQKRVRTTLKQMLNKQNSEPLNGDR